MKQYASLGAPAHNRYEHRTDGVNSRMDGMQGLFLSTKLKHLDEWTNERINVATKYNEAHTFPTRSSIGKDVYHVFYTLQENRDSYIEHMKKNGIQTGIHYPISLPELECFKEFHVECKHAKEFCSKCVSLPMFPYMTDDEIKATLESHKSFPHLEQ
jgi:dTDP-4-amino-4,6-dideoxygalactose transaminase